MNTDRHAINKLIDMIGKNLRKILPDDWDFALVVWRVVDTSKGHDTVEVAMASQGNPEAMEQVLRNVSDDVVATYAAKAAQVEVSIN
jgi:hypothetical protein